MARKTFLQHWIMGAKLVSPDEMSSESVGENDFQRAFSFRTDGKEFNNG